MDELFHSALFSEDSCKWLLVSEISSYCCIVSHGLTVSQLVSPVTHYRTSGCLQIWNIMNKTALNIHVQVSV